MNIDVIVIGGGPAGMFAAITAAEQGCKVVLIEANNRLGKKLLITGKGRCNVTNNCEPEEFFKHVRSNPRFLYSALNRFEPKHTMELFEKLGVPLKTERGNRVFPVSDKSLDIVDALVSFAKSGADIINATVKSILASIKVLTG